MDKITADAAIVHKDYVMAPGEVAGFIKKFGVTAQAISRMGIDLDANMVNLGLLTLGLDALTEQEIVLPPYNGSDFIYNVQNPCASFVVEGTYGIMGFPGIGEFVSAIANVPDAMSGKPTTDVFAPIPRVFSRLVQYNFVPEMKSRPSDPQTYDQQILSPVGKIGIGSIRYISRHGGFLLALLVDGSDISNELITLPLSVALRQPARIGDHSIWKRHGRMTDRNILTLGRPTSSSPSVVTVVAHFEGGFEAPITIQDQGREFRLGDVTEAKRVAIGVVSGTGMKASYRPRTDFAELVFEPKDGAALGA